MQFNNDYMTTYTGKRLDPLNISPDDIDIVDIAHSLSQKCRFQGHIRPFYSVAQHSVMVARLLPDELKLEGLLHDAAEAYYDDLIRPIKYRPQLAEYRRLEGDLEAVIAGKFGLPYPLPLQVKAADDEMALVEAKQLFLKPPYWTEGLQVAHPELKIFPWSQEVAEVLFLESYNSWTDSN